jgi:uncharacterized protein (TIGR03083 family)
MVLDNLRAIRDDSTRFSSAVEGADLGTRVPSCPEWTVRVLVEHLGRVQRFWADTVRAGDPQQPSRAEHPVPASDADLLEWMRGSTDQLLDALEHSSPEAPCWTWWGAPRTCGAVARHQVQEAAVHRWDAEAALGEPTPIEAAVADDGVTEFLEIVVGAAASTLLGSVSLVSDDTGGGTWIVGDQRGPRAEVRGPASDLVLFLYGRRSESELGVEGDAALLRDLLGAADTE